VRGGAEVGGRRLEVMSGLRWLARGVASLSLSSSCVRGGGVAARVMFWRGMLGLVREGLCE
jgi:hypothetical protein